MPPQGKGIRSLCLLAATLRGPLLPHRTGGLLALPRGQELTTQSTQTEGMHCCANRPVSRTWKVQDPTLESSRRALQLEAGCSGEPEFSDDLKARIAWSLKVS